LDADLSNTQLSWQKTKILAKSCINHWDHKKSVENHCATNQYRFCFFSCPLSEWMILIQISLKSTDEITNAAAKEANEYLNTDLSIIFSIS
jgi:hypothetical protein